MILPSKTVQPVDSLISISAYVIEILKYEAMNIDDLLDTFNRRYYKEISIEKMMLAVNFLYITEKIEYSHEIIKTHI